MLGACWVAVALMTVRQLQRFSAWWHSPLASEALSAVLVFIGLYWIGRHTVRDVRPFSSIGLVGRPTQWAEFAMGLAFGWGVALALVLPALLTLHMQSKLYLDKFHFQQMAAAVLLVLANAIATQLVFTGLLFRSLVRATSGAIATVLFSLLTATIYVLSHPGGIAQAVFVALAQVVFSLAALRTRAIWLPLGIQFAWGGVLLLIFGVPSFYWPSVAGVVRTYLTGSAALTGGSLGPESSVWALLVLVLALFVLWRATRDYAWHYTFDPIEGAGYAMEVAPPKEHTRMEAQAATQSVLVQIAPTAPSPSHSDPSL